MHAYSWWNRILFNEYMLQTWVLTTLLSLILRFAFTIFRERYDRDSFKIALTLGFILGLVSMLGGYSFISIFTGNINFNAPPFYLIFLILWSFFLSWGSLDILGNTILGSLLLSCIVVAFSISSIESFNFTRISDFILGPGIYIWFSLSLLFGLLFLVYFWLNEN